MTSMWASISCRCPKNELQEILKEEMGGIQRLPAVMYDLFVGNYEVLPTEPLHDVKEHICNVLTELPAHLEKKENHEFQNIIECTFAGKEKLRGCDYRLAAVIVAQYLRGQCYNYTIIPQNK